MILLSIDAPHFNAGVVISGSGQCVEAAPIIKYMMTWNISRIKRRCKKKGWTYQELLI